MRIAYITALALLVLGLASTGSFGQEKLTEEQARAKIEEAKRCEEEANAKIAEEQVKVDALEAEVTQLDDRIDAVAAEIAELKGKGFDVYTVKEGDWLSKLAEYREVYGHGNYRRWPEIYKANGDLIKDPNLIYPGWELKIPRP